MIFSVMADYSDIYSNSCPAVHHESSSGKLFEFLPILCFYKNLIKKTNKNQKYKLKETKLKNKKVVSSYRNEGNLCIRMLLGILMLGKEINKQEKEQQ